MVGRKRRRESWFRFQLRYQPNHPLCSDCSTVILISLCTTIPNTTIPQYCNTQYYIPTTPYVHCSACKLYITSTIQVSHKHHVNKYCTRKRSATVVLQFRATPSVLVTWIALPCFFVVAENWIPTKLHLLFSNLQEDRFCVDRLTYLSRRILHCWIWQMPTTDDVSKARLFSRCTVLMNPILLKSKSTIAITMETDILSVDRWAFYLLLTSPITANAHGNGSSFKQWWPAQALSSKQRWAQAWIASVQ